MSGIIGPATPARIAFALGTIGVGALVGGAIADHRDSDVGKGALFGGLAAVAGLTLLFGGAYAWNRFSMARAGATSGASQLGTTLSRFTTPTIQGAAASAAPAASSLVPAASSLAPAASSAWRLPSPASLFHQATPALTTSVPVIARTPLLPVASLPASGGTFLDALRSFLPR